MRSGISSKIKIGFRKWSLISEPICKISYKQSCFAEYGKEGQLKLSSILQMEESVLYFRRTQSRLMKRLCFERQSLIFCRSVKEVVI